MIYLTYGQALCGVAAGMWTEEQFEAAKKNPDGHIKHHFFLDKQTINAPNIATGDGVVSNS